MNRIMENNEWRAAMQKAMRRTALRGLLVVMFLVGMFTVLNTVLG